MRRRSTRPRVLSSLVTLALTGVAVTTAMVPAHAVTVPCDTAALITAIENANAGTDTVIDLAPYCLYEVTAAYSTDSGLPPITNNTGGVTVNGHHATIKRVGTAPFRLFEVGTGFPAPVTQGSLTLNDLTVMNGQPSGGLGGGAVLVREASTFAGTNVAFQGGTANLGGGIRFRATSTGTLTDSRISDNLASGGASGGGGLQSDGRVTLTNTHVTGNRARVGGGIGHSPGTLTINGGSIKHNTAFDTGGGISKRARQAAPRDGRAPPPVRSARGRRRRARNRSVAPARPAPGGASARRQGELLLLVCDNDTLRSGEGRREPVGPTAAVRRPCHGRSRPGRSRRARPPVPGEDRRGRTVPARRGGIQLSRRAGRRACGRVPAPRVPPLRRHVRTGGDGHHPPTGAADRADQAASDRRAARYPGSGPDGTAGPHPGVDHAGPADPDAPGNPGGRVAEVTREVLDLARARLAEIFAEELEHLPAARRAEVLYGLDAVTTWGAWYHWRSSGLSAEAAASTMETAVHALLATTDRPGTGS